MWIPSILMKELVYRSWESAGIKLRKPWKSSSNRIWLEVCKFCRWFYQYCQTRHSAEIVARSKQFFLITTKKRTNVWRSSELAYLLFPVQKRWRLWVNRPFSISKTKIWLNRSNSASTIYEGIHRLNIWKGRETRSLSWASCGNNSRN